MAQKREPQTLTLSKATTSARRLVGGCLVFIIVVIGFQVYKTTCLPFGKDCSELPPPVGNCPYLAATKGYGDLPDLTVDSLSLAEGSSPQFTVSTGGFGELSSFLKDCPTKAANVYKVKTPKEGFGIVERAETIAKSLGFTETYKKISDQELEWKTATRTLKFNKVFKTWDYKINLTSDPDALKTHKLKNDEQTYVNNAINLIDSLGIANIESDEVESQVYYMTLRDGALIETAVGNAQYIQVNLYIQKEAMTPREFIVANGSKTENEATPVIGQIYTTTPEFGTISLLLTDEGNGIKNLYGVNYTDWGFDVDPEAYEIISIAEAWTKITNGEGSLRYLKKQDDSPTSAYTPLKVKRFITGNQEVGLGYFEDPTFFKNGEKEEFLLPIYVFKGTAELEDNSKADFIYFVDALKR